MRNPAINLAIASLPETIERIKATDFWMLETYTTALWNSLLDHYFPLGLLEGEPRDLPIAWQKAKTKTEEVEESDENEDTEMKGDEYWGVEVGKYEGYMLAHVE
jgi:hypothetical protein